MKIYIAEDLTNQELIDFCNFDKSDLIIGNQTQIDFIIIFDYYTEKLPYPLSRHIKTHSVEIINKIINDIETTIFIFLH